MPADFRATVIAAIAAAGVRFGTHADARYLALSLLLSLLWVTAVRLFGGYDSPRPLAWDLEKTGVNLGVASALLVKGSERAEQMSHQDYPGKGVAARHHCTLTFITVNIRQIEG